MGSLVGTPALGQAAPFKSLVALFDLADTTNDVDHDQALNVMSEAKEYFDQVSYGRLELEGIQNFDDATDVVGPISTALPSTGCGTLKRPLLDVLTAQGIDWAAYDLVVLVAPFTGCSWAGLAGGAPGAIVPMVHTNSFANAFVTVHEIGHTLGGGQHANFLTCEGGTFTADPGSSSCVYEDSRDPYTPMGAGGTGSPPLMGHFSVRHKLGAGFLDASQLIEVMESGTFELTPLEIPGGLKGLRIRRFPQFGSLYVEFRRRINLDAQFYEVFGWTDYSEGAMIRGGSNLLDATPTPTGDRTTPTLRVGQTLTDPVNGNTITVDSLTPHRGGTLTVTVDVMNPYDLDAPVVTMLSPVANADVWGELIISADVTDAHGVKYVEFWIGRKPNRHRFDQSLGRRTAPSQGTTYEVSVDTATLEEGLWYSHLRAVDNVAENRTDWISTPFNVLHVSQGCGAPIDGTVDADADGVYNWDDNCPAAAPGNQTDSDGDGIGNLCDCDFDNDGICAPTDADDGWAWYYCKNNFDPVVCAAFDMNSDGVWNGWDQWYYDIAISDGLPGPAACTQ